MTERIVRVGVPEKEAISIANQLDANDFITRYSLGVQIKDLITALIEGGFIDEGDVLHFELRAFEGSETGDIFRPVWVTDMRDENIEVLNYFPPNVWNQN